MDNPASSLVRLLEEGRASVADAVRDLPDAVAAQKPAPDRWSVLECLEHITLVEHRFLGFLDKGQVTEDATADAAKEARLTTMVRDRSTKVQAPETVVPTGRFTAIGDALADFNATRDGTIRLVQERGASLYPLKVTHPRFGDMNGVELMHMLNGHAVRHVPQIEEIRRQLAS
jgi:hypothetical protein